MIDRETYRTAFCVRVPQKTIHQAMENAQKEIYGRRKLRPRSLLAASLAISLLCTTAGAELSRGTVTNLLAPLFGSARTELLEEVGRPVNASVSADGYTLTAEAIIGDRHNLVISYSFTREDGNPVPEHADFEYYAGHILSLGAGSCDIFKKIDPDEPNKLWIYEHYTIRGSIPRTVQVGAYNFVQHGTEDTLIASGPWLLSLTLRYPDTTMELPGFSFSDAAGRVWELDTFSYSALGCFLSGTASGTVTGGPGLNQLDASMTLKDGTIIPIRLSNLAYPSAPDDQGIFPVSLHGHYGKEEDAMLLFSQCEIESFTICGTTVPIP